MNITKMSLENGVMGLPVDVCRNWNALTSIPGKLIYAGRECPITFSPKHKRKPSDDVYGSAGAWQFTINDSIQFSKLRIDGVYTYADYCNVTGLCGSYGGAGNDIGSICGIGKFRCNCVDFTGIVSGAVI